MPLVTLTGAKRGTGDRIELRFMQGDALTVLADADWASARGLWLEATCRAAFVTTAPSRSSCAGRTE